MSSVRLAIREEVGIPRVGEVVTCGVPLPAGSLREAAAHVVTTGEGTVPSQVLWSERDSAGWIRWLGLAFPVDVAALGTTSATLHAAAPLPTGPVIPSHPASVLVEPGRAQIGTGRVQASVSLEPFAISSADLSLLSTRVVLVGPNGAGHPATLAPDGVEVVYDGPLLAQLAFRGRHAERSVPGSWSFRARLTARAGASSFDLEVGIVNDEDTPESSVAEWVVEFDTGPIEAGVCGVFTAAHRSSAPFVVRHRGQGHPRGVFATSEVTGGDDWSDTDGTGPDRWEWSELHGRHAGNWVIAHPVGRGAVTVAAHRFAENHPGELAVQPTGVAVRLWPMEAGPLRMTQGAAKTRAVRVARGSSTRVGMLLDSPLLPYVKDASPAAGVSFLPYLPEQYPNLEAHIREELSSWHQSGQSLGFHDFGDSMQGIVTGPRTGYSANNEHDALLALTLHYLRTGERVYYDSAQAYADHLCDIDQIHHSTAWPAEVGGLRAHGPGHVQYVQARTPDGFVRTSIDTGHLWTEGLVLFGRVAGERRYLDAAQRVADCIVGLIEIGWTRPEPGPRNAGWPLIALTAVAHATGEQRYLDAAARTAKAAIAAQRPDGRWLLRIGLVDDYCAWQNAVLLIGLARLLEFEETAEVRASFETGSRAMLELGRNRDGTFVYLTRFDYRWANRSALIREALALGFHATSDERFLQAGLAGGGRWYRPRSAAPALSNDVAEWRGHLPFLAAAHNAGLLQDLSEAG